MYLIFKWLLHFPLYFYFTVSGFRSLLCITFSFSLVILALSSLYFHPIPSLSCCCILRRFCIVGNVQFLDDTQRRKYFFLETEKNPNYYTMVGFYINTIIMTFLFQFWFLTNFLKFTSKHLKNLLVLQLLFVSMFVYPCCLKTW